MPTSSIITFFLYVLPTLSVRPRFDITLPVGGHVCSGIRDGEQTNTQCFDASSFDDSARRSFPRWWSLSLGMQLVLPGRGARAAGTGR